LNLVPRSASGGKIPVEIFTGKSADAGHLRTWGAECVVFLDKRKRPDVFDPKGVRGRFVGYGMEDGFKAYYVWLPKHGGPMGQIVLARSVRFLEKALVQASRRSTFAAPHIVVESGPSEDRIVEQSEIDTQPTSNALPITQTTAQGEQLADDASQQGEHNAPSQGEMPDRPPARTRKPRRYEVYEVPTRESGEAYAALIENESDVYFDATDQLDASDPEVFYDAVE
jgi:hypothetical protein